MTTIEWGATCWGGSHCYNIRVPLIVVLLVWYALARSCGGMIVPPTPPASPSSAFAPAPSPTSSPRPTPAPTSRPTSSPAPFPTPTVRPATGDASTDSQRDEFDLASSSAQHSFKRIDLGSRVEVAVIVQQQGDEYALCAKPTVKDAFGNVLATLSPVALTPGATAAYKFAFYAAAEGRYSVELNNRECSVRQTAARATVNWIVHVP